MSKQPIVEPPAIAFVKENPGLAALLVLSAAISLWAATRRAPKPEVIPDVIEPAVESPAPAVEAETPAPAPFVFPAQEPEPAPRAAPIQALSVEAPPPPVAGHRREDGTFESTGAGVPGR